jgi:4-methylaminobutanoate oxidase (formaldehyde-forming)
MGYVTRPDGLADREWVMSGVYEIEVAGERVGATVSLEPFYDPKSSRPRS